MRPALSGYEVPKVLLYVLKSPQKILYHTEQYIKKNVHD